MIPSDFLRKKFTQNLSHTLVVEFLTYLITYVSNLIRILVPSSSKLREASLVVVVVVGRWFS